MKYEDVRMGQFVKTSKPVAGHRPNEVFVVASKKHAPKGYVQLRIPGYLFAIYLPADILEPTEWPAK
jgi:hypothetical protein